MLDIGLPQAPTLPHQVHHRGQAQAMLSGTSVRPPQLEEFSSAYKAPLWDVEFRNRAGLSRRFGARWMLGRDRYLPRFYSLAMSLPKVVEVLEG